ncbi:branched-chain amino acid ABC transporter permease [Acuticoccus sp. MNP-M23]|uniref:branched-chain amino acid ABC transporter permease n=1 Tax=Acuticoccus sp. MNP-M23 TaxID=3072793 RepID=UPI0028153C04|nr:branched-chain amino acid ABC transporter permease [Acuticoccus sp. MNP-M23]WMS40926.1 branched-chain amino acid ABC transporter permease [Acuticoccus sp. MNP-M23]
MSGAAPRLVTGSRLAALGIFGAFALLPLVAVLTDDMFLLVIASRIMIFALAAIALDLILGYGAMVSFGHAAFFGIGAYAVAILTKNGITDIVLQTLAGAVAAALFALVTGALSLRTRGVYFIMITLAFGQMAFFFAVSLSAYGGDDGFSLGGRSSLFGTDLPSNDVAFFYLVLVVLVLAYVLLRRIVASRFGRVLRGTRENPVRMGAIGFATYPYRLTAYVISGALTSVAGVLLANQIEFVAPAFMTWHRSGELIVMVVLGGMGTLIGPVAGATIFILLEEWLAAFSQHWKLGFGIILILFVLFGRGGLAGLARKLTGGAKP